MAAPTSYSLGQKRAAAKRLGGGSKPPTPRLVFPACGCFLSSRARGRETLGRMSLREVLSRVSSYVTQDKSLNLPGPRFSSLSV